MSTATIQTTRGLMDEALLLKKVGLVDNENERTTTVEYCLLDCSGQAHLTGEPDAPTHFCARHVHRSAAIHLKKPVFAFGEAASLGE